MKVLVIATIIFIVLVSAIDQEKLNGYVDHMMQGGKTEKEQARSEYNQWQDGLFDELFDNQNPNIRVFAIRQLLPNENNAEVVSELVNKLNTYEINTFIDEIINHEDVSAQALNILAGFCFKKNTLFSCDNDLIQEKLIELEPDNMRSYALVLDNAVESQNSNEISEALSLISDAKYNNNHFYLTPEFEEAVGSFVAHEPIPQSYLEYSNNLFGFDKVNHQYTQEEIADNMFFSTLIGIQMAIPLPNFYTLIKQECKDTTSFIEDCLNISNKLINQSYTVLSKWFGYDIQIEINKNANEREKYQKLKDKKKAFNKIYTCITQSMVPSFGSGYLIIEKNYRLASKAEREEGQFAKFKIMAELSYQDQISKGNTDAINPDTCFE